MTAYILRRLLLMVPTLFGIMLVTFAIVQFAPGGPVERMIAKASGFEAAATGEDAARLLHRERGKVGDVVDASGCSVIEQSLYFRSSKLMPSLRKRCGGKF